MIAEAVNFARKEIARHLGLNDGDVIANSARKLAEEAGGVGAYISLINIEEEPALRNTPHVEKRNDKSCYYVEPPVFLNLYLLIAFKFDTYETSLIHLSKTIELFQSRRWFSAVTQSVPDATPFPASLDKLVFEMVNMNFEQLNNLWGVLGDTYFPSVVYKVRMIKVQLDKNEDTRQVASIVLNQVILKMEVPGKGIK